MFALPTWLAIYLSIGTLFTLCFGKMIADAARPLIAGMSGARLSLACATTVLTFVLLWPYVLTRIAAATARAAVKVLRDAPYPHASPHGGYQPRPSGKDRGNPPSGGSSGRRPGR